MTQTAEAGVIVGGQAAALTNLNAVAITEPFRVIDYKGYSDFGVAGPVVRSFLKSDSGVAGP